MTSNSLFHMSLEAPALNHALLEAAIRPMSIDELLHDIKAKRWATPSDLYKQFGFTTVLGPSFAHGLMRFLAYQKLLSFNSWLRVWA